MNVRLVRDSIFGAALFSIFLMYGVMTQRGLAADATAKAEKPAKIDLNTLPRNNFRSCPGSVLPFRRRSLLPGR